MEEMYCKHDHSGQRATAIGLAAGLGGGALLLAVAAAWGVNKASEARAASATQGIAGLTAAMAALNGSVRDNKQAIEGALAAERVSREGWQMHNTPSVQSYIDVQATPQQNTVAASFADAYALASAINNNNGLNSAIGTESFLKVARYSAPKPCGCDTCGCGCGA